MTDHLPFNRFAGKSWQDKVLDADALWAQIKQALSDASRTLPATPRRPDVRLIVNNISGADITFKNPGDHSGSKDEVIPASGTKTAAMIMIKGDTLDEQHTNAQKIYARYDLGNQGLSQQFIDDMKAGKLADIIDEAYGPAPLDEQAGKLVDVAWQGNDGTSSTITPVKGTAAAFGARAATNEQVFIAQFHIFVKGTGTTPEMIEGGSIAVAISSDWQTGKETTRPIVPSIARTYYGAHFDSIPVASVHPDGIVTGLRLPVPASAPTAPAAKRAP